MTYSRLVADNYMHRHDYNCAETMLRAGNEAYDLRLDERALRVASPFGGGMGRESTCGALTGALMALAALRASDVAHRDARLAALREELVSRFEARFGSLDCAEIKARYRDPELGCQLVVAQAAKIVEEVLASE